MARSALLDPHNPQHLKMICCTAKCLSVQFPVYLSRHARFLGLKLYASSVAVMTRQFSSEETIECFGCIQACLFVSDFCLNRITMSRLACLSGAFPIGFEYIQLKTKTMAIDSNDHIPKSQNDMILSLKIINKIFTGYIFLGYYCLRLEVRGKRQRDISNVEGK